MCRRRRSSEIISEARRRRCSMCRYRQRLACNGTADHACAGNISPFVMSSHSTMPWLARMCEVDFDFYSPPPSFLLSCAKKTVRLKDVVVSPAKSCAAWAHVVRHDPTSRRRVDARRAPSKLIGGAAHVHFHCALSHRATPACHVEVELADVHKHFLH